jgi:hypothetical protein
MREALRLSASEAPLFAYMVTKHSWTPEVIDLIDWDAFCMAARNYLSTEVHLLKLVHDKLPMQQQVARYQEWTNPTCHYCSAPDTMDHFQLSVCNPASIKFREEIIQSLRTYLQNRTSEMFTPVFVGMVDQWLQPNPEFNIHCHQAINSQATIGFRL